MVEKDVAAGGRGPRTEAVLLRRNGRTGCGVPGLSLSGQPWGGEGGVARASRRVGGKLAKTVGLRRTTP
jgi:hypothetical protein